MSILSVLLFILFVASISLSRQASSDPNCVGVEDFKDCLGNTENFCPTGISCQCKNEKPFCRCDYYRVGWQEYWYMGPKCNHLWNTLDFILVTILPAVGLVIIVVAIFCCIYYAKGEKNGHQTNPPYQGAQHNPAFTADVAGNVGRVYQQSPRDTWTGQIPKVVLQKQDFDDVPIQSQLEDYSPVHPQPLNRPDHFSNRRAQYEEFDCPRNNLPYAGYGEARQYQKY